MTRCALRFTLFPYTTLFRSGTFTKLAVDTAFNGVDTESFKTIPECIDAVEQDKIDIGVVPLEDRKSTRLNSSHVANSYAVFCLEKKIRNKVLFRPFVLVIKC